MKIHCVFEWDIPVEVPSLSEAVLKHSYKNVQNALFDAIKERSVGMLDIDGEKCEIKLISNVRFSYHREI